MKENKVYVVVENHAINNLKAEHGLSLYIQTKEQTLLFDTGAGDAFLDNIKSLNLNLDIVDGLILSHGHKDHTGAIMPLPAMKLWYVPGVDVARCSCHAGVPVRHIGMPYNMTEIENHFNCNKVKSFQEIYDGIYLTGTIPRLSMEDCGGPFFFDAQKESPDKIEDEQSLLFKSGVLITGCCHAGIINTIEYCLKQHPEISIHTIIGGLHLNNASEKRLEVTADYLNKSEVKNLYLMHCTGDNAIDFLKEKLLNCNIFTPVAGEEIIF